MDSSSLRNKASSSRERPRMSEGNANGDRALRANSGRDAKKCFSWINRCGERLQVSTPKALQHPNLASYKFFNFITVLGPARQGKSFLMNCLLGDCVFGTSDTIGVCTKGIQVACVVQEVGNGGVAFFVDTEGQGDEDVDSDTTLLTPILLLSKVILFNWKGGLQKNQILNELAILVEVGNCVSSNSFGDSTSKFGHLHIVLRDFHFQGTAKEAFSMIFDEENRRGEKVKERNKVREKLLSSFRSINVSIFPTPCEDIHDLDRNTTSEEFQESVKELKDTILDQMSQPRSFGSVVVNSKNVDVLVRKFVEELEERDIVHVKSVVGHLQRGIVDEAKRCFEESLVKAFKEIGVPVRDAIEELLTRKRDALLDTFEKSTAKIDLGAVYKDEVLENLELFADRELDAKRKENQLAIKSREAEQNAILATAEEEFRSAVESELRRCKEGSRQMEQRFQEIKNRLLTNFLEKTGQLNWIQVVVEKRLENLKRWVSVRLDEKIEAKQKEEEYAERSEQQVRLSRERMSRQQATMQQQPSSSPGFLESFFNIASSFFGGPSLSDRHTPPSSPHSDSPATPPSTVRLGGQFTPGGGRAPSRGCYMIPSARSLGSSSSTPGGRFYRGGQFTLGRGRAPSGGSYMTPSTRSSGSSSSTPGGRFYRGGQFTPGRGRAPRGGCRK